VSEVRKEHEFEKTLARFRDFGEERVFRFWPRLDERGRRALLDQASGVDLAALKRVHEATRSAAEARPPKLEAVAVIELPDRTRDLQARTGDLQARTGDLQAAREAFERAYFEHHLAQASGSIVRVAEKSGLERTHLYRKLKALGIATGRKED